MKAITIAAEMPRTITCSHAGGCINSSRLAIITTPMMVPTVRAASFDVVSASAGLLTQATVRGSQ